MVAIKEFFEFNCNNWLLHNEAKQIPQNDEFFNQETSGDYVYSLLLNSLQCQKEFIFPVLTTFHTRIRL